MRRLPLALLAGEGTREALGFPETTRELHALPEAEMPLFYGAATALLMPSRFTHAASMVASSCLLIVPSEI